MLIGEFVIQQWQTLQKVLKLAIQEKDHSWIHFEDMKFLIPFLTIGQDDNPLVIPENPKEKPAKKLNQSKSHEFKLSEDDLGQDDSLSVPKKPKEDSAKKLKPPKLYEFRLSEDDIKLVEKVKEDPFIYSTNSYKKNKAKKLLAFYKIGIDMYGKKFMVQHRNKGNFLLKIYFLLAKFNA